MANGMKVASLETHTPNARLGLFFDAGSRYETQDNMGITHFFRNAAFAVSVILFVDTYPQEYS